MASSFGWLDHSEQQRNRMLEVVSLFHELGPAEAARRLLHGPDASDRFTTLWGHGRLDATVDGRLLLHHALFEDDEREVAYRRLEPQGAPVGDWFRDRLGRRHL